MRFEALLAAALSLAPVACTEARPPVIARSVSEWAGTWEADLGEGTEGSAYREHWRLDGVRVVQSISPSGETRALGTWEVLSSEGGGAQLRLTYTEPVVADDRALARLTAEDAIDLTIQGDFEQTVAFRRTFHPVVRVP